MKTELSPAAQKAKRAYQREYRRNMTPEAREKQREYNRQWRRSNPDKVQASNIAYWERKAAEVNNH